MEIFIIPTFRAKFFILATSIKFSTSFGILPNLSIISSITFCISSSVLTYKRDKLLSEVADKRLKAIKEFTEFGSGFKIAMSLTLFLLVLFHSFYHVQK